MTRGTEEWILKQNIKNNEGSEWRLNIQRGEEGEKGGEEKETEEGNTREMSELWINSHL